MSISALGFAELRQANAARQDEWEGRGMSEDGFGLLYLSNALGGEVGEAQNVVKKMERERLGAIGSRASAEDLAKELADVVIYADLVARAAGIDLGVAVAAKFNATSEKYGFATRLGSGPSAISEVTP